MKECKETGKGRIEMAGDYSVIADPYLWKRLNNDYYYYYYYYY